MPFQKGRVKTGGRPSGTPQRIKLAQTVLEMLEQMGHNPIERMAMIAEDEKNPIEVRAKMESELASYGWAKRKSVEHTGTVGTNGVLVHNKITIEFVQPERDDTIPARAPILIQSGPV